MTMKIRPTSKINPEKTTPTSKTSPASGNSKTMKICGAPCSWGVDDPKNPHLPAWSRVLEEASLAGYTGIELGPYGYLPLDIEVTSQALAKHNLNIVAGTIFDNLVDPANLDNLLKQAHDICGLIQKLPDLPVPDADKRHPAPYLVIIDWGHKERDIASGQPGKAPRLSSEAWATMMDHIRQISAVAKEYGVRPVIHPHAGGYIEFADEIRQLAKDIDYDTAGLCLDTGHLYYSQMDPASWLREFAERLDYVHFKDVNQEKYDAAMGKDMPFFDVVATGVMCPIGTGNLNYEDIRQTLLDIGYSGYITIEQERDPRDTTTSLRDVKASRDYLTSVGFV